MNTMNTKHFTFEYIIQDSTGLYYRGTSYGDARDWTKEKREGFDGAFHYTIDGAWKKICTFPMMFEGCKVVRDA